MTVNGVDLVDFLGVILATGLLRATPLVVAALGEAIAERAGLLNLGIEGMMLAGAFFGFLAAERSGSLLAGIVAAVGAGLVLGLVFGLLTVGFRVDQVLVGLAITIFAAGLTAFLFRDIFSSPTSADVDTIRVRVPGLRELPVVGRALFTQQLLFYVCWALVPVVAYLLYRTRFGLNVRAVGESPFAADAAGVDVARTRLMAIALAGALAGLAGGFLCPADIKTFSVGMTVGQGFIALAIAMLGRWNPWRIVAGALVFGLLRSTGDAMQILGVDLSAEFTTMLPYVGIMLALVLLAGRTALPAALGVPYARGQR